MYIYCALSCVCYSAQKHISVMDEKRGMVYDLRDFPLPIVDVQSEKESVQDIVYQRDEFGE